jgi:hypothetical protein
MILSLHSNIKIKRSGLHAIDKGIEDLPAADLERYVDGGPQWGWVPSPPPYCYAAQKNRKELQ